MNNLHSCLPFPVKVMATSGTCALAEKVCEVLRNKLTPELQPDGKLVLDRPRVTRFSNDNIQVQVNNVRGHFVVILHTQTPQVNDELIELFALINAVYDSHPADLLVVFPYMPYARSDRKNQPRISTMGNVLPRILNFALDVKRVIIVNPHDAHLIHYYHPVAEEVSAVYLVADHLERTFFNESARPEDKLKKTETKLVFPDSGAAKRFEEVPKLLNLGSVYIDKERSGDDEAPTVNGVVGDVNGKDCVVFDDEILTGNSAIRDAITLRAAGARKIIMVAIHAGLRDQKMSDAAIIQKLNDSPIDRFVFTDTVPVKHKLPINGKFTAIPTAGLIAEAISRTVQNESLTKLYDPQAVELYRL